jgi:hypothetical protein
MLSQQQNDIDVSEKGTPPSLDQKQLSAPTYSWRSWSFWLRVLGVILAFAGFYGGIELGEISIPWLGDWWTFGGLMSLILVGAVSAALIRSWWSLLIVPVAFGVGGFLLQLMTHTYGNPEFSLGLLSTLLFMLFFVEIGVAVGTTIGNGIEQRLQQE